eukprot:gb/GECG01008343.1/.p1 GENE.gb/GECG01008343.1/~~gb/GECG01008343.1/.p1  ORF type:complete len:767 (+),score=46.19 gb/GECG01008343.1/:1-2301(+)
MCHGIALPVFTIALLAAPVLLYDIHTPPMASWWRALKVRRPPLSRQEETMQRSGGEKGESTVPKGAIDPHEGLVNFVQISDLHISKYNTERSKRLSRWFSNALPMLQPKFLIVSGDLTDANRMITIDDPFEARGQIPEEWMQYHEFISKYAKKLPVYDIRGNHDAFNVPSWDNDHKNYFKQYSSRADSRERHYRFDYKDDYGYVHSFVFIDAVIEPAPTRHFFGELKQADLDTMEELLDKAPVPHTKTVVSHYPYNSIHSYHTSTAGRSLEDILEHYGVMSMLSGHLHHLSFIPPMYARHPAGTLELELGDFKWNSIFRIAAFDRGNFAFKDVTLNSFLARPTVLVTSPVDCRFGTPFGAPLSTVMEEHGETSIRFIIFSSETISGVQVEIDSRVVGASGSGVDTKTSAIGVKEIRTSPLRGKVEQKQKSSPSTSNGGVVYAMPWPNNVELTDNCGVISVKVLYASKYIMEERIRFCKDGTMRELPSRFLQWFMTRSFRDIVGTIASFATFSVTYMGLIGAWIFKLLLGRGYFQGQLQESGRAGVLNLTTLKSAAVSFLCKIYGPYVVFMSIFPKSFYLVLYSCVHTAVGPWFFGRLFDGEWAALFSWGHVTFDGTVLPHLDSDIYISQIIVLGMAPFLQLMSMIAVRELRLSNCAVRLDNDRIFLRATKDKAIVASVWTDQETARPRILVSKGDVQSPTGIFGIPLLILLSLVFLVNMRFNAVFHGLEAAILSPLFWLLFIQLVVAIRMTCCAPWRRIQTHPKVK